MHVTKDMLYVCQHWTDVAKSNMNSAKGFASLRKTLLLNFNTK